MNQDDLGATTAPASADFLLAKRKRGRPRKDENLLNSDNASVVGRVRRRRRKADSTYSDNAMVGQIVSGVLDGSFDSGYLLTVRVGDTHTVLRGVVFEPGRSVPITAANDVAPHVKIFERAEVAIPANEPCNLTPASIHMLQPVFKSDRSARCLHKSDPSHRHRISPSDVRKEQAVQTEKVKCSDELPQKQASTLAEKALENDSCQLLHATSQSLDVDTKATHTFYTSKKGESNLPEGRSHETGQAPLTTSESENGSSSKKQVTDDIEPAQLKQPHNDVKEASESIELAQVKRSLYEGNEVPAVTPLVLSSKVKTEDVQDMPKELTVPLPMELPCDANEESRPLQTDIKMEKLDSEPRDAIISRENEDIPSQHETAKESGTQGPKETILALDEPDANEDEEVVSQALDIMSDTKQPLLQIHPEFEGAISMGAPRAAVHDLFSEAKTDKLVDTIKFGDDSALPKTESVSQSDVETLCGTPQNVLPATGIDQLAEIGILKDEKFAVVPVVKSISSPNQSAPTVPEESLMPDVQITGQVVGSNHGDEIDDPQGLQFIALDKPVVVSIAEEPLLPDVEATSQAVPSNHRNDIVDPQGLPFIAVDKPVVVPEEPLLPDLETAGGAVPSNHRNEIVDSQGLPFIAVDKPVVVPEEPLLPDLETAGGAVASNQGDEIAHANPDDPTNLPVEKPPLSQDGVLSDDAVVLEASKNGNFGGWEEVMVEPCQSREEAAKVSGTGVNSIANHP
ncbi:uncharacterized protein LOC116260788 [Nymphaea colorata]|nr:uncharacterized protein LOC116260788 [Nymphaea colorata]XP_031495137.1 uncharacterized protein LOC116260788 [Nymphaea colorata]